MPECFDPAWEYFEPDPEVAELFAETGAVRAEELVFGSDADNRPAARGSRAAPAYQFNPNPNAYRSRLAPPKQVKVRQKKSKVRAACATCEKPFYPERPRVTHCSRACAGNAKKTANKPCAWCRTLFLPRRPKQKFCGHACKGLACRVPSKPCERCGKAFWTGRTGKGRFCSRACMKKPRRECRKCAKPFTPTCPTHVHCSKACRYG